RAAVFRRRLGRRAGDPHARVARALVLDLAVGLGEARVLEHLVASERLVVRAHEPDEVARDRAVRVGARLLLLERQHGRVEVEERAVLLGRQALLQLGPARVGVTRDGVGRDLLDVLARHADDLADALRQPTPGL